MTAIAIVGDGPGGLSAALFLAKAGHDVQVFGTDESVMHYAMLYNYLGVDEATGSDFQARTRAQVAAQGAKLVEETVNAVRAANGGFEVETDSGTHTADFLVLSEGKEPSLAPSLGVEMDDDRAVVVDRDGRTSVDKVYAVGRSARPNTNFSSFTPGAAAQPKHP